MARRRSRPSGTGQPGRHDASMRRAMALSMADTVASNAAAGASGEIDCGTAVVDGACALADGSGGAALPVFEDEEQESTSDSAIAIQTTQRAPRAGSLLTPSTTPRATSCSRRGGYAINSFLFLEQPTACSPPTINQQPMEPRATHLSPLHGNPLLAERRRLGPLHRDHPTRQRLVRRYAYGIPTDTVLDAVIAVSPAGVVELGAGTGYWARLLHDRGVDVVAYDVAPPESGANRFVDTTAAWFPVRRGDADVVADHADRALLVVWPTWNETWAGDAAARFHAAGGHTLIYVGEGPGGRTGDATLHARLGLHGPCLQCSLGVTDAPCVCGITCLWEPTRNLALPRWADAADCCGIYHRFDPEPGRRSWLGRRRQRARGRG